MSKKKKRVRHSDFPYCSLLLHRTRTEKKSRDEFSAACQIRVRGHPGVRPACSRAPARPLRARATSLVARALVSRGCPPPPLAPAGEDQPCPCTSSTGSGYRCRPAPKKSVGTSFRRHVRFVFGDIHGCLPRVPAPLRDSYAHARPLVAQKDWPKMNSYGKKKKKCCF